MNDSSSDLFLPRMLATLISVVLVGLGVMTIVTRHYYGRTSKLGGAEVILDGRPAIAIGFGMLLFGLFPLAFWFRTRRLAMLWMVACLIGAGAACYVGVT
jgi:hypothetical protein